MTSSSSRDPHSSSRFVSGASSTSASSSVSEGASKESRHQRPNDNDREGGESPVKWRCFAKGVTSNDVLLTFVPNSFQDLKLLLLDDESMHPTTKRSNTIDIIQGRTARALCIALRSVSYHYSFILFLKLFLKLIHLPTSTNLQIIHLAEADVPGRWAR